MERIPAGDEESLRFMTLAQVHRCRSRCIPLLLLSGLLAASLHGLGAPAGAADDHRPAAAPISSAADDHQPAGAPISSAAEIAYPPFSIVDDQGQAGGFSVELLRSALRAMGREVSFRTGTWNEVRDWLEQGDIEALPLVGRTPEREAIFDFSVPYMSLHGALVVRGSVDDIHGLDDLVGKSVAVMAGDNAEEFLRRKERGIEILTTPTFEAALQNLADGLCDAVLMQRLVAVRLLQETGHWNLQIINRPVEGFRQDFCFAVREGDRETLALLNEGLALVIADGTYRHLHARWFAALTLPARERIVVGGDHSFPPFEFLDKDGRPAGYNVDLMRAIAREVGLDIEIRLGPWAEIRRQLAEGAIDAIQGMLYSPERDLEFDFTQPHMIAHYVAVARRGEGAPPARVEDLSGKRIVVQDGDIMHDFAVEHGLGANLVTTDSQEDALRQLSQGKHDCALVARLTALYWIRTLGWDNLQVSRQPLLAPEYCFAVPQDHRALLARLSDGLQVLEQTGEYRRVREKWVGVYEESSPRLFRVLRYLVAGSALLLILLLASVLWTRSLRRQVARRTAQLQESERKYRHLADNSLDIIWTMNLDLVSTYVNQASQRLLGYAPDEFIGSGLADHFPPEELDRMKRLIAAEIAKGPASRGAIVETTMFRKDRSLLPVEIHGVLILDEQGRPESLQGITRDISERVAAEARHKALEQQLAQAQRLESVGRLAGGVAHDYNNMLSVIIGYADMALHKVDLEHPLRSDLEEILKAARRSADITRQLLAFARQQTIDPKILDLNSTVASMLTMLRRLIGEQIDLAWMPASQVWPLKVDPSQIDQILANLCVNARDAIEGVGQITIETANRTFDNDYCADHQGFLPGDFVMLAVSDSGAGMDAETLAKVFEPFFTTKEMGKGTGLGLATVYGIAKQNHGFVNIYSEPGRGTTIKIYLPRHAGQSAEISPGSAAETPQGSGETILLVEDEPSMLELGQRMLAGLGYRVLAAAAPGQARRMAESHSGDLHLLITDVIMPEMNGRDLAATLTSLRPDLKVLFMSGYTANVIAHRAVLDDGVHFIQKPFSRDDLAAKVWRVLHDGDQQLPDA